MIHEIIDSIPKEFIEIFRSSTWASRITCVVTKAFLVAHHDLCAFALTGIQSKSYLRLFGFPLLDLGTLLSNRYNHTFNKLNLMHKLKREKNEPEERKWYQR